MVGSEDGNASQLGGAFLSDEDLQDLVENREAICRVVEDHEGEETEKPMELDPENEGWSDWTVDLSLGEEVFLSSDEEIRFLRENESLSIDPGEFALLVTDEIVNIPNDKTAFISLKFGHARKGLINISGFHVDPNYKGRLVFSVYNASPSPVILRRGQPVFMIVFANLTAKVSANRDEAKFQGIRRLKSGWLEGLQGRTASVEKLNEEVGKLKRKFEEAKQIVYIIGGGVLVFLLSEAIRRWLLTA